MNFRREGPWFCFSSNKPKVTIPTLNRRPWTPLPWRRLKHSVDCRGSHQDVAPTWPQNWTPAIAGSTPSSPGLGMCILLAFHWTQPWESNMVLRLSGWVQDSIQSRPSCVCDWTQLRPPVKLGRFWWAVQKTLPLAAPKTALRALSVLPRAATCPPAVVCLFLVSPCPGLRVSVRFHSGRSWGFHPQLYVLYRKSTRALDFNEFF